MKVVIAGGTGMLGRHIAADLRNQGHQIVLLTRRTRETLPYRQVEWDGLTVGAWAKELDGAALINLAGKLVDKRPTNRNVELLRSSRVDPTVALVNASRTLDGRVPVWIQASTLSIYGYCGEEILDENALIPDGPPQGPGVARAWEAAVSDAHADRLVVLRTAMVLSSDSFAIKRLAWIARLGFGGRIGNGKQWFSWIHIDDFLAVIRKALASPSLSGVLNVTSPNPVRNEELMTEIRRMVHCRFGIPSPELIVQLGAFVLDTDPYLALSGRRGAPARLEESGFKFSYPYLGPALDQMHERREQ